MQRADWTYISGVTAVAETRLLTDDEYLDLLRQPTLAAMLQRLKQLATYVDMPAPEAPEQATRLIEREYIRATCALARQSPDPIVCKGMLSSYIFAEVRALLRRDLFPTENTQPPGMLGESEIDALSGGSVDGRLDFRAMADRVRPTIEAHDDPTGMFDLLIDREEIVYLLDTIRCIGSDVLTPWLDEEGLLRAAVTLIRAQLAGVSENRLIDEFLAPPLDSNWLITLVREDFDRMDNVLMERFTKAEGEIITVSRHTVGRIAREADDRLTHRLTDARRVAFGPERLLGYLWALRIENLNLRLIAETFVVEADRDETRTRLRQSYVG